jgi:CRP/FNR family transcriptional regulator, cyclic AMP receptor protein
VALGLGRDSKQRLIASVPLFAGLSKKEVAQVASIADELDFKPDKILIREGEPGREFFILVEGGADVTRAGKPVATHTAGDFFGEIALMCDSPRGATVTTTEPSVALVITDRDFKTLVKKSPQIALKVMQAVGDRLPVEAD